MPSLIYHELRPSGIAMVTLNDPQRRNAMNSEMADEFHSLMDELSQQPNLRVLILTGAGPSFAAGGDLTMLAEKTRQPRDVNVQQMMHFYGSFLSMLELRVPLIAAINGHAMGAGFCLALACDFRLASRDAKLALNFAKLGLHAGMGATCFLPRITGYGVAVDLLLTGRTLQATEAADMGLVHAVVDGPRIISEAMEFAEKLLLGGPLAIRAMLATLRPSAEELEAALQREATAQSEGYESEEFQEGLAAVLEKRAARFE